MAEFLFPCLDRGDNPRWQVIAVRHFGVVIVNPEVRAEAHRVSKEQSSLRSGILSRLAPKRKPTKFQQEMAKSVDDLSAQFETMTKQFAGFQTMMRETLDKLDGLQSWKSTADESLGNLLQKTDAMGNRVNQASARLQVLDVAEPTNL